MLDLETKKLLFKCLRLIETTLSDKQMDADVPVFYYPKESTTARDLHYELQKALDLDNNFYLLEDLYETQGSRR